MAHDDDPILTIASPEDFDEVLVLLEWGDANERKQAAGALGEVRMEERWDVKKLETAIDPLTRALDDRSAGVRRKVAETLGDIGGVDPSERNDWNNPLKKAVDSHWSAPAKPSVKWKQVVDLLVEALDDDNPQVRSTAAESIGRLSQNEVIGGVEAINPLLEIVDDPHPECSEHVKEALGMIRRASSSIPTNPVYPYINDLKHDDPAVRHRAVERIGEIAEGSKIAPKTTAALIKRLSDDVPPVRRRVAELLGEIWWGYDDHPATGDTVEALTDSLDDNDTIVRRLAAQSLREIRFPDPSLVETASKPLIERLEDEDSTVRREAAETLGSLRTEETRHTTKLVNALNDATDDDDVTVRARAISALGRIGADKPQIVEQLVDPFIETLDTARPIIQKRVVEALGQIGEHDESVARRVVGPIIEMLDRPSPGAREQAVDALENLVAKQPSVRKQAVGPLTERLNDPSSTIRKTAAQTLWDTARYAPDAEEIYESLSEFHDSGDLELRLIATKAFGRLVDRRSGAGDEIELLIEALDDPNPAVRTQATTELGRIGESTPSMIVEAAAETLLEMLADENPEVRKQAVDTLWWTIDTDPSVTEPLVEPLIECLDDTDQTVRDRARQAIESLEHRDTSPSIGISVEASPDDSYNDRDK